MRLTDLKDTDFVGEGRISCWRVTQQDIDRLAKIIRAVKRIDGNPPKILDVGTGKGLVASLLAESGFDVYGFGHTPYQEWDEFMNRARQDGKKLTLENKEMGDFWEEARGEKHLGYDVVHCSWMPFGKNWSDLFYKLLRPKIVIHVIGAGGVTGIQGADEEMLEKACGRSSYDLSEYPGYQTLTEWPARDFRDFSKDGGRYLGTKSSLVRVDVKKSN